MRWWRHAGNGCSLALGSRCPVYPRKGVVLAVGIRIKLPGVTQEQFDAAHDHIEEGTFGRLASPRTIFFIVSGIIIAIVGLYVLLPKLVGVSDAFNRIGEAKWYWIIVAIAFVFVAFGAYAAVFRAVVGGGPDSGIPAGRLNLRASLEITMAGFAGSTFFSAAGAGGLIIIYWALRKAGMEARRAACRMVALLVLLYAFYALAVIFGTAYGGVMPLYAVLAREYFGQKIMGTVFGLSLGGGTGPVGITALSPRPQPKEIPQSSKIAKCKQTKRFILGSRRPARADTWPTRRA